MPYEDKVSVEAKTASDIAIDQKSLDGFVLDLCAFSLDKAQFRPADYAFHLHVALRRQAILQETLWKEISEGINQDNPLTWSDEAKLFKINQFAQSVVAEVREANLEPWGLRLVKTSFLSHLDKARSNSEKTLAELTPPPSDVSKVLEVHIQYLDALLVLPFLIEKVCINISEGSHQNYDPKKNAAVLAAILDTLKLCTGADSRIEMLKMAVKIAMPSIPANSTTLDAVTDLLPHLDALLKHSQALEKAKDQLFAGASPETVYARRALLSAKGVHLDSLPTIVQNTLFDPMQQCINVATGIQGMIQAANQACQSSDYRVQLGKVATLFSNFDNIAKTASQLDPGLLPIWVQDMNRYYTECRSKADNLQDIIGNAAAATIEGAYLGFGRFYQHMMSFLPQSIQWYFEPSDELSKTLKQLNTNGQWTTFKTKLDYLAYFELARFARWDGRLEEKFFESYMGEVAKKTHQVYTYAEYKAVLADTDMDTIVTRKYSLFEIIQQLNTPNGVKENSLLALMHRIKTLELHYESQGIDINAVTFELETAIILASQQDALKALKIQFLIPGAKNILNSYLKKHYLSLLENFIDNRSALQGFAANHIGELADIYSKLCSNLFLSRRECQILDECFSERHPIPKNVLSLTGVLQSNGVSTPNPEAVTKALTPNQEMAEKIKTHFATVSPILEEIIKALKLQQASCSSLQRLAANESPLHAMCSSKSDYITEIITVIRSLKDEIEDNNRNEALAKHISSALNGDTFAKATSAADLALRQDKTTLFNSMMRFAWHVCPNDNDKNFQDNFLTNLLAYSFDKTNNVVAINHAKNRFNHSVNTHILPELTYFLNDPLAVSNILPGQEQIMDKVVEQFLGLRLEKGSMFSWAHDFLKKQMSTLVANINQEEFIKLFPFPFLGQIAVEIIRTPQVQEAMAGIVRGLAAEYGGNLGDTAFEFAEAAKQRFYVLLGVEIQLSIEKRAIAYAQGQDKTPEASDAFAMYYLRYRAIRKDNPDATTRECTAFLFEAQDANTQETIIRKFSEVDTLPNLIPRGLEEKISPLEKTRQQLQFLITHLNFHDADNLLSIRMALLNNYILMAFETASQPQLSKETSIALQNEAITALSIVLTKAQEQYLDMPKPASMAALTNSRKRAEEAYKQQLDDTKNTIEAFLTAEIKDREEQLLSHGKKGSVPRLGENVHLYHLKVANKERRTYLFLSKTFEFLSFAALWASIIAPLAIFGTNVALLQSFLAFFGMAGVVGASATVVGAVIFGVVALIRFSIKLAMEIWGHRQDFDTIATHEPNVFMRGLKYTGLALRCMGAAFAKTLFSDYLVGKIKNAFRPVTELKGITDSFPSADKISKEKAAFEEVRTLIRNLPSPEAPEFSAAFKTLSEAMDKAKLELNTRSNNDYRNRAEYINPVKNQPYVQSLDAYWKTFEHFKSLNSPTHNAIFQRSIQTASKTFEEKGMEQSATPTPLPAKPPVLQQPINLVENYQKELLKRAENNGVPVTEATIADGLGVGTTFISDFYEFIGGLYAYLPSFGQVDVTQEALVPEPITEQSHFAEEKVEAHPSSMLTKTKNVASSAHLAQLDAPPPSIDRMKLQREASRSLLDSMGTVLHPDHRAATQLGLFGKSKSSRLASKHVPKPPAPTSNGI